MQILDAKKKIPEDNRDVIVFSPVTKRGWVANYDHISKMWNLGLLGYSTRVTHWVDMPELTELQAHLDREMKYREALEKIAQILPMGSTIRERECWEVVKSVIPT